MAPITSNGLPPLVSATLFFKALTRRARPGDSVRRERIGSSSSASRPSARSAQRRVHLFQSGGAWAQHGFVKGVQRFGRGAEDVVAVAGVRIHV